MVAQQTRTTHPYDLSPRINPAERKIFDRRIVHKHTELLEQLFYLSPRALINVRADVTVRQSLERSFHLLPASLNPNLSAFGQQRYSVVSICVFTRQKIGQYRFKIDWGT